MICLPAWFFGRLVLVVVALAMAGTAIAQDRSLTKASVEQRLALVVGNSAYRSIPALLNPANDVRLISRRLRDVGFQVDEVEDADLATMKARLRAFSESVSRAGKDTIALVYYAGHGVQDDKNRNYLIPVDAELKAQADLVDGAVKVEYVQELIDDARPKISFLILDACRDNPLPATSRGMNRGLAPVDSRGRGTFIAFSTAPGQTAIDGEPDGNSPYATALAAEIVKPASSFDETFRRAHLQVMTLTNGRQIPWKSSSVVDEFSFVALESPAAVVTPVEPAPSPMPPSGEGAARESFPDLNDPDLEYQKTVLADSIEEYERLLQRFPKHPRRDTIVKLISLKREDVLWRQIEQEPDANQQLRLLDRLINAFADGAYLERAKRRRADLTDRLNPPSPPAALPPPPPPPVVAQQAHMPPAAYVPPPPPATPSVIQILSSARWAVGSGANCGVARKSYRLVASGGTIRWQDGTGNVDVETIAGRSATHLNTVTVRSMHRSGPGVPIGSRWTYELSDPSLVRVTPLGKSPFVLVSCR